MLTNLRFRKPYQFIIRIRSIIDALKSFIRSRFPA